MKITSLRRTLAALTLAGLLAVGASAEQLLPTDNTDAAPHFAAFRTLLKNAIVNRDAAFIAARSKGARVTFGTPTTLEKQFKLSDPDDRFWTIAQRLLSLGGTWDAKTANVYYPYVYAKLPDKYDPYTTSVVIGKDVNVRKEASKTAATAGVVSYEIVELLDKGKSWSRVRAADGLTGYVSDDLLMSPIGYRMGFQLVKGRWMMTLFVSGD